MNHYTNQGTKYNKWLNNQNGKNLDYVKYFYNKIHNICTKHGVNINDEKEFRKEIGIFVYNNTDKNNAFL